MQERLIREPECRHLTGLSRQRRWELAGQGHFPPARKYPGMQKPSHGAYPRLTPGFAVIGRQARSSSERTRGRRRCHADDGHACDQRRLAITPPAAGDDHGDDPGRHPHADAGDGTHRHHHGHPRAPSWTPKCRYSGVSRLELRPGMRAPPPGEPRGERI